MPINKPLEDGELLAAIDLGSNSFHMVVARYTLGQLRVVDRLRETVRMASGLSARGDLSGDAMSRALECLGRMGQRLRGLSHNRVRAIATNTVRQLRSPASFLIPGETALGHRIEVVSGREEARLIYLGVANGLPPKQTRRLVIDIGGGSTEFIIGEGFEPLERESLQMGCIASTRRFFPSGKLSRKKWRDALTEISAEFQQFTSTYRARGWREVIGSSGTAKAIGGICKELKISRGEVTAAGIADIRERLLAFDDVNDVELPGLSDDRRTVMAGGLLVMEACFNELGIERMQIAQTAMREGVLYDMLGRAEQRDPRDGSIAAMAKRYGVDMEHAARVEATVQQLFEQVSGVWRLDETDQLSLMWAARIHEIGLAIAHSQHHVHGAYLIENSDIAGFSTQEQRFLGVLLRAQRRNLPKVALNAVDGRDAQHVLRCVVLLRLGVLLNRSHDPASMPPDLRGEATEKGLALSLAKSWLDQRPLSREDLHTERALLAQAGFDLAL